ncbi:MAG: hypothetical protein AVDCRST_MAG49-640, partial [uncultured Thermomicrobiales bacterium]
GPAGQVETAEPIGTRQRRRFPGRRSPSPGGAVRARAGRRWCSADTV